ncbi:recombinase family protein [Nocardia sp. NPDC051756]|uniref:recombinase family protein n=1 Tax=Nocardia sp. NPDC051756 TaxID=3154751 RepID=UPI003414BDF3
MDRLGRNAIQLNKLFGWCIDHEKTLVSCSESIDLGTWAGRMLASVIAGLAEGELKQSRSVSAGRARGFVPRRVGPVARLHSATSRRSSQMERAGDWRSTQSPHSWGGAWWMGSFLVGRSRSRPESSTTKVSSLRRSTTER